MGAFLIYPIFKMVFDSFFKVGITGARTFIGFDNYIKAFTAGGFEAAEKYIDLYFDCGICGNSFGIYFCIII